MIECGGTGRLTSGDWRGARGEAVGVHGLTGERLWEAAFLLTRCFHENPNFVGLFPDEGARSCALPRMLATGLRDAMGFGHVYAATRGAGGELTGVAAWLPPGAFPLSPGRQLRALLDFLLRHQSSTDRA